MHSCHRCGGLAGACVCGAASWCLSECAFLLGGVQHGWGVVCDVTTRRKPRDGSSTLWLSVVRSGCAAVGSLICMAAFRPHILLAALYGCFWARRRRRTSTASTQPSWSPGTALPWSHSQTGATWARHWTATACAPGATTSHTLVSCGLVGSGFSLG